MNKIMKKRALIGLAILLVIGLVLLVVVFKFPPYATLAGIGLIPSHSDRVYTIGERKTDTRFLYVALGDSLSAGVGARSYQGSFPYLLAQSIQTRLGDRMLLRPHARPGATTEEVSTEFLDSVITVKPDLVTIMLGVNDVHRGVAVDTFIFNYESVLRRLAEETEARVYILNIPHIGVSGVFPPAQDEYLNARAGEFNEALNALASLWNVPVIDLYTPTREWSGAEGYYAKDHFHPSEIGYGVWANIIYDAIY